jgi:uncharacterized protein (TIGR02118 family)
MIKLTFCLRRLPELTRAEFQEYWRETHGALVREHRAALKFEDYRQIHTIEDPIGTALAEIRHAPAAFDGVAEMVWTSREALEETMSSKEGRAAGRILLDDEKRFIDLENSPIWLGQVPFSLTSR